MSSRMSSLDRNSRAALSCNSCRSRKSKCNRLPNGSCQRCTTAGKQCITTNARSSRPYYQTSKEQFELISAIIHHFLPQVSLEVEDLRNAATTLKLQRSNSLSESSEPFTTSAAVLDNTTDLAGTTPTGIAAEHIASTPVMNDNSENQMDNASKHVPIHIEPGLSTFRSISSSNSASSHDTLIPDATNTPRLDSGSGWASFFRKIHSSVSSISGGVATPHFSPCEYADGKPISVVLPTDLPPRDCVEQAVNKFFSEVNNIIFVLSFEQFEDIVEHLYDNNQPSSNARVTCLLAVIALAVGSDAAFERAYGYFDQTVAEGSLESVQAIILLALCRLNRWERNAAWILLGCAHRTARSLGLNRKVDSLPRERRLYRETKVKLWWALYSLDTSLTCSIGQPLDRDQVEFEQIYDGLKLVGDELCIQPYTPPGYQKASATLSAIADQILRRLYSNTASSTDEDGLGVAKLMLSMLTEWLEALPLHLKLQESTAPAYIRAISHLYLRYNEYIILLTRPYLLESELRSQDLAVRCEDANKRSIAILKELVRAGLLSDINYLDGIYVMSNGMILFLRALRWPSAEMLKELEDYYPILQKMGHLRIGKLASDAMVSYMENLRSFLSTRSAFGGDSNSSSGGIEQEDFGRSALDPSFNDLWASTFNSANVDWSLFPP